MGWTSIVAIYALFWTLSAFLCLPFGRADEDAAGPKVAGQADSAPANFRPGKVIVRATILSMILCGLFVANYSFGWIGVEDIDILSPLMGLERDR
jgi:predicted secreted protein